MNIVYRNPGDLKPYPGNAKKHTKQQIGRVAQSIQRYGFKQPVVIDGGGVIVIGHCRTLAAMQAGLKEIPCVLADDLTAEQIRELRLVDNRTNESAWDSELLAMELADLNVDLTDFGFSAVQGEGVHEDEFDEKPPSQPLTQPGDLWTLGRHRLLCGDATDPANAQRLMDGQLADMLLTDPPYNVDYTGKTKDALKIRNDIMADDQFRAFLAAAFLCADSVMKPGAVFYIWHADSEGYNFRGACHDIGWTVRQCLIWRKNAMVLGRQDYQWVHEPSIYGWKEGASHLWASDRKQTTVLEFDRPSRSREHPTMKPVLLFDYQIRNNTKAMDQVLDLFGGSGTTLIACEQNGRVCRMMEIDPKYCDVIVKRYIRLVGSEEGVSVERDGEHLSWALLKEAKTE